MESKGYTEEQAEGFIEAVEQIDLIGVSTKADIKTAQSTLQKSITELSKNLQSHRETTVQAFAHTREEIYKAMFYQSFAIIGLTVTLLKFLG